MEAVARGSDSSMEGVLLFGKVMELQIGVAAATRMQMEVVPKDLGKDLKTITYMIQVSDSEMAHEQRISRSFWMLGSLELMLQIS